MSDLAPLLITGAGKGVGFFIAKHLNQLGYPIIAHYHTGCEDKEAFDRCCITSIKANLFDQNDLKKICDIVKQTTPVLRGIIHNASSFAPMATDIDAACEQMQQFFTIHMQAPFYLNMSLQDLLLANEKSGASADIIHITDIYSENPNAKFTNYCATKAGLENLNKAFAKLFAPAIKVNSIQPGPISFKPWHDQTSQNTVVDTTLLKRLGTPEAIAKAVVSLLDNDFITGTAIKIDGGRHLAQS